MSYSAIILCGGNCSRFNFEIKHLQKIGGKPILQHIINSILKTDVKEIIVVHSFVYEKKYLTQIEGFIPTDKKIEIKFVLQNEAKGTAHAMKIVFEKCEFNPEQNMLIFAGDMPFISSDTINNILQKLKTFDAVFNSFICEDNPKKNKVGRLILDNHRVPMEIIERKIYEDCLSVEETKAKGLIIENTQLSMPGLFAYRTSQILFNLISKIKADPYIGEYTLSDLVKYSYNSYQLGHHKVTYYESSPYEATGVNSPEELIIAENLYQKNITPSTNLNLENVNSLPKHQKHIAPNNLQMNSLAKEFNEVDKYPIGYEKYNKVLSLGQ